MLIFIFSSFLYFYVEKSIYDEKREELIIYAKNIENKELVQRYNARIDAAAFWIFISAALSLLLGLMHSFYFIGKAGGIAPNLIFQGISYALITPVLGISLFMICKILRGIFNKKNLKS